jgi:tRNA G18 (ribose-2'-O)-methylase SpoU
VQSSTAVIEIISATDDRISDYRSLKDVTLRRALEPVNGLYIAESAGVIRQAIDVGHRPRSVLLARDRVDDMAQVINGLDPAVPVYIADYPILQGITGFHVHRGALASMHRPPPRTVSEVVDRARRIVVLESLVDHTNVGAVIRSIAALGWDGVLLNEQCADPLYRRSVRVSMGAVFQVPWAKFTHWDEGFQTLTSAEFSMLALTPSVDAMDISAFAVQPDQRIALLIGTEGQGLSATALAATDIHLRIPMAAEVDSLNVGAAAAIALWQLR